MFLKDPLSNEKDFELELSTSKVAKKISGKMPKRKNTLEKKGKKKRNQRLKRKNILKKEGKKIRNQRLKRKKRINRKTKKRNMDGRRKRIKKKKKRTFFQKNGKKNQSSKRKMKKYKKIKGNVNIRQKIKKNKKLNEFRTKGKSNDYEKKSVRNNKQTKSKALRQDEINFSNCVDAMKSFASRIKRAGNLNRQAKRIESFKNTSDNKLLKVAFINSYNMSFENCQIEIELLRLVVKG